MITLLTSIFNNRYLIIGLLSTVLVFGSYKLGNYLGYKDGVSFEQERLNKEYNELLNKKLTENNDRLKQQFDLALKAEQSKSKTSIVYKDRIVEVKKIIKESNVLNNEQCKLEKSEIDKINELTGDLK